jgi:hypothetical protein
VHRGHRAGGDVRGCSRSTITRTVRKIRPLLAAPGCVLRLSWDGILSARSGEPSATFGGYLAYLNGMDHNLRKRAAPAGSARTRPTRISPATYWRRRVSVLAVGIGLLTTLCWTVSGMLAARSSADQAAPPGGARAAGSAPARESGGHALPAPSPSPRLGSVPSRHRSTTHTPASGKALACAPGGVTLRLSSPQYWYQVGKVPSFTVHAVSTERQPCRFNMGTKFVSVVIASDRRVWSSADCVSGNGSNVIVLTRGTPAVLDVSWDRRTSSPGCSGTSHVARPGEYKVTAVAGHLRSKTMNFVLGAQGASGP